MLVQQTTSQSTRILSVNTGSSSVRLALFSTDSTGAPSVIARARYTRTEVGPGSVHQGFLLHNKIPAVTTVTHRVVHAGERLVTPRRLDAATEVEIERLSELAPLHNPLVADVIDRVPGLSVALPI